MPPRGAAPDDQQCVEALEQGRYADAGIPTDQGMPAVVTALSALRQRLGSERQAPLNEAREWLGPHRAWYDEACARRDRAVWAASGALDQRTSRELERRFGPEFVAEVLRPAGGQVAAAVWRWLSNEMMAGRGPATWPDAEALLSRVGVPARPDTAAVMREMEGMAATCPAWPIYRWQWRLTEITGSAIAAGRQVPATLRLPAHARPGWVVRATVDGRPAWVRVERHPDERPLLAGCALAGVLCAAAGGVLLTALAWSGGHAGGLRGFARSTQASWLPAVMLAPAVTLLLVVALQGAFVRGSEACWRAVLEAADRLRFRLLKPTTREPITLYLAIVPLPALLVGALSPLLLLGGLFRRPGQSGLGALTALGAGGPAILLRLGPALVGSILALTWLSVVAARSLLPAGQPLSPLAMLVAGWLLGALAAGLIWRCEETNEVVHDWLPVGAGGAFPGLGPELLGRLGMGDFAQDRVTHQLSADGPVVEHWLTAGLVTGLAGAVPVMLRNVVDHTGWDAAGLPWQLSIALSVAGATALGALAWLLLEWRHSRVLAALPTR